MSPSTRGQTTASRSRVFCGATLGGLLAAGSWVLLAKVNAMGAGAILWPLGIGAGLGARLAGGRDKKAGYVAAGIAVVTIFIGDAIALRYSIAWFRAQIEIPEQAYKIRLAEAEFWVNRPQNMSREELKVFAREHRIGLDSSDPKYFSFYREQRFMDRDLYYSALDTQLQAFHESPPPMEEFLSLRLTQRHQAFDQETVYGGAWKRLYLWTRWVLLALAGLAAYLTVQGRPTNSASEG